MSHRLLIAKSVIPVLAPVFPAQLFILFLSLSPPPFPVPSVHPPPTPAFFFFSADSMENEMNLSFAPLSSGLLRLNSHLFKTPGTDSCRDVLLSNFLNEGHKPRGIYEEGSVPQPLAILKGEWIAEIQW